MKRPSLVVLLLVLVTSSTAGCAMATAPAPHPSDIVTVDPTPTDDDALGSPIVFALHCGGATHTTYAAAWAEPSDHCTVERIAGRQPSVQQSRAVATADGHASLEDLAAICAEVGSRPWTDAVGDPAAAARAAALLLYCPGHPEADRLRSALAAYRT